MPLIAVKYVNRLTALINKYKLHIHNYYIVTDCQNYRSESQAVLSEPNEVF